MKEDGNILMVFVYFHFNLALCYEFSFWLTQLIINHRRLVYLHKSVLKNRFVAIFLKSQVNPLKQKGNKIVNAKNRRAFYSQHFEKVMLSHNYLEVFIILFKNRSENVSSRLTFSVC